MRRLTRALLVAATASPAAAQAQDSSGQVERNAFTWEGAVPAGRWLYLRNVNGEVRVERAAGDRVTVTADKTWRRGDPASARVVVQSVPGDRGVVVCALYTGGDGGRCDADAYSPGKNGHRWWGERNDDVGFRFTVRVPAGVRVDLHTTNGDLVVRDAGSEVVARTTNGNVHAVSAGGPVTARTTNGNLTARMTAVGGARDLDFSTTNGSVSVALPESIGAEVSLSTTNGSVSSEFPATVSGRIDRSRLHFTLGDGSRRVRMRTTNGNVELRKAR